MRLNALVLLVAANVFYLNGPPANANKVLPNANDMISTSKDKDYDPGKEITDDPHGPNPHGPNPHGPAPEEEQHDKNLPANNPDRYFGRSN
jgi:hypothetical protein